MNYMSFEPCFSACDQKTIKKCLFFWALLDFEDGVHDIT